MHIFEVEFTLREGLENERFPRSPFRPYVRKPTGVDYAEESIEDLLRAWYYNGQTVGKSPPLARTGGGYRAFVRTPAEDSLFEPHHSEHARAYRGDWTPDRWGTIQVRRIGEVPEYEPQQCPGHPGAELILFTWCLDPEPPVRCAECFGTVPLYTLPPSEQGDRGDILGWEDDYRAFDMLGIGDDYVGAFAHNEMDNPESLLSRFGLRICARVQEASGRRMWYHLERVAGADPESERERRCPRCGGEWLLPECWHDRFDFRCERCGLLSNLARRYESWNDDDDGAADADGGAGA